MKKKPHGICSVCKDKIRTFVGNPKVTVGHYTQDGFWCQGSYKRINK